MTTVSWSASNGRACNIRRSPSGSTRSANRVPMVMSQVAKLLNVEGYPVVSTDPATGAVTLDAALLAEQYGVRA